MNRPYVPVLILLSLLPSSPAFADATLFLGEPYGVFGSLNPTGHAAVFLSRICASTPTVLRRCEQGETGVVISRYSGIGGFDWLAIPLIPYLYAVDHAEDAPPFADKRAVRELRDGYRRAHLRELVPDADASRKADWIQLVGAAYDRRLVAFSVKTTPEQDEALICALNARTNVTHFNLFFRNCAGFSRDIFNLYFPEALSSSVVADFGLTTPKHVAKSLARYSESRPGLALTSFVVPQVPGNRAGSKRARGIMESLLKTKKYVIPLAVAQPWIAPGLAAGYFITGRFNPKRYGGPPYGPVELEQRALRAVVEN